MQCWYSILCALINQHGGSFIMPIPQTYSSSWLSKRVVAFNYPKQLKNGLCFGLAMLGQTAFLMEEMDAFDQRLQKISDMDVQIFKKTAKIIHDSASYRELDPFFIECLAFFDGLALYQIPSNYMNMFEGASNQRTVRDIQWLLPEVLQNKLYRTKSFSGNYNLIELENYLRLIKRNLDQSKIPLCSLMLECGDHAIQLGYNYRLQEWSLVDSMSLPTSKHQSIEAVAFAIFKSFYNGLKDVTDISKEKAISIFTTTMTVRIEYQESILQIHERLTQNPVWSAMHQVSVAKATSVDSMQNSWLILAALIGEEEVVKQLLAQPAVNVNQLSEQGIFPLYMATIFRQTRMVELLLKHPAIDLTLSNDEQATGFLLACQFGSTDIVNAYMQHPDIQKIINTPDKGGYTPVVTALMEKNHNIIYSILARAELLDLNIKQNDGNAFLHLLCVDGDIKILDAISKIPNIDFEVRDVYQNTPFMIACQSGKIELARWLIEHHHVNVNAVDVNQDSSLLKAIESGKRDVITFLLSLPCLDLDAQDINDDTPFICACQKGDLNSIRSLVDKGCNVMLKNVDKLTGLDILIQQKAWKSAFELINSLRNKGVWTSMKRNLSQSSQIALGQIMKLIEQQGARTAQVREKHARDGEESNSEKKVSLEK